MNKSTNFWSKLFEKHESHPDITSRPPDVDFGSTRTILLVGVPLLSVIALVYWYISTR